MGVACSTGWSCPRSLAHLATAAAAAAGGPQLGAAVGTAVDAAAPVEESPHPLLPQSFRAARQRVFGNDGDRHSICSLAAEDGRPNFFLLWPLHVDQFGQQAFALVESVLFHHPSANVVVVSVGLAPNLLDAYLLEGYCAVSISIDSGQADALLDAATQGAVAPKLGSKIGALTSDGALLFLMNSLALALQVLYGGVSLPMDGLLLNPFDFMIPSKLSMSRTAIFVERLLFLDGPPSALALAEEDYEKSWLPRSHSDRADGYTVLCLEVVCPRAVPAQSAAGRAILQMWMHTALEKQGVPDVSEFATTLYRVYIQGRPAPTPFKVDGFPFDHEMVVLPYWCMVEPHFRDGWKAFGGHDDRNTEHSQLYSPRPQREAADWVLTASSKLWLPLGYGPPSARNILPRSVVDLAMKYFTLGIMPRPYRSKAFGRPAKPRAGADRRLRSPRDAIDEFGIETSLTAARHEGALPGHVGGFRTFRQVRIVGKEDQDPRSATLSTWRLIVSGHRDSISLFCRREHRPLQPASTSLETASFRACEAALQRAKSDVDASTGASEAVPLFDACGTPAELNAAVTLLAYTPTRGLGVSPLLVQDKGADLRLTADELGAHFSEVKVEASSSCTGNVGSRTVSTKLAALLDDVEDHITVIAHCAERCHLLDRLALSFREAYSSLAVIATCECSEDEHCPEPVAHVHPNISGMTLVSVPYDFGLSRGKSLLVKMAKTEFVLVLDDDFVHSFHSCLECMLWRMRSRYHSQWRPFDILGFPILEDERMFGAFRGKLRVTSHQLFLEPLVEQPTPDGCVRVDICPMVFLARTARIRIFKFEETLTVGEHEHFFYSNAYFGMQVAVCFDSSFPHFRVNTMSAGYVKRRERMPALMQSAFAKLGHQRAMYLFRKYATDNMSDYNELLDKAAPPWYISDDSCGPRASPPVPFSQVFVVVLSTGDDEGARYRMVQRGLSGSGNSLLKRLAEYGPGNFKWTFAVSVTPADEAAVLEEQAEYRDVILVPRGPRVSPGTSSPAPASDEGSTEELLRIIALLRDFQFRWLVVLRQDVFVQFERLLESLERHEGSPGKVLGAWSSGEAGARSELQLDPRFFMMSRDIFAMFAHSSVGSRLAFAGVDHELGDLAGLRGGLNAWLRALAIDRVALSGLHFGSEVAAVVSKPGQCPAGTFAVGPLSPEHLHVLSEDPSSCRR